MGHGRSSLIRLRMEWPFAWRFCICWVERMLNKRSSKFEVRSSNEEFRRISSFYVRTSNFELLLMNLLIQNGRVIDPSQRIDTKMDLLITDGVIAEVGKKVKSSKFEVRTKNSEGFLRSTFELRTSSFSS